MKKNLVFLLVCISLFSTLNVDAQQSDSARRQALIQTSVANLNVLRNYQWEMNVEVTYKGKKTVRLFNVQWKPDGSMVISEKSGSVLSADESANELVLESVNLIARYSGPTDKQLTAFLESANMQSDTGNMIELSGGDYMVKEDRVTMDIDKIIFMTRSLTFTTVIIGDDVMGTIEYAVDANSLKHPSKVKVDMPAKRLSLNFENKNFTKK